MEGEPRRDPATPEVPPKPTAQQFARMASAAFTDWLWASMFRSPTKPEAPPAHSSQPPSDDAEQRRVEDEQVSRRLESFRREERARAKIRREHEEQRLGLGFREADGTWVSRREDPPQPLGAMPNWFRMGGKVYHRRGFGPPPDDASAASTPPDEPSKPGFQTQHIPWLAIGAAFLAVGTPSLVALYLAQVTAASLWSSPAYIAAVAFSGMCTLVGFYTVFAPFTGWKLPEPSPETQGAWRIGSFAFLAVMLIVVLTLFFNRRAVNVAVTTLAPAKRAFDDMSKPRGRIVVDVSPKYLTDFYSGRMTSESDRLFAPYKGKWIRRSSLVYNVIQEPIGGTTVWSGEGVDEKPPYDDDLGILLMFDPAWDDRVGVLQRGQKITYLCEISSASGHSTGLSRMLSLDHCELQ
jgi:hypothetical protein